jgi:hypothetical protein
MVSMRFDPTKKLSELEVKDLIDYIWSSGGTIIPSRHAKERMVERGYSLRDIMHIISNGSLVESEFNNLMENWKYRFEGEDLDDTTGGVVVSIARHYKCIIITVLS